MAFNESFCKMRRKLKGYGFAFLDEDQMVFPESNRCIFHIKMYINHYRKHWTCQLL